MIIVIGSVNIDFVVRGDRLPKPGETVVGGRFFQAGGGKGANQALAALRAAEGPVAFIGAVGDDELGRSTRDTFMSYGMNCEHLLTIPRVATGVALIMVGAAGENAISVASGANGLLSPDHIDSIPDRFFAQGRVLLASLEVPRETVARALGRARQFGVPTILNPAPADPYWGEPSVLSSIDFLTPNETEAVQLAGQAEDPVAAATTLAARMAGKVLLTQGAAGVRLVGAHPRQFPACRVAAVDTTAAGDAFNGAFAAALAERWPLDESIRFAVAAATLSVTREGAQPSLPARGEILAQYLQLERKSDTF